MSNATQYDFASVGETSTDLQERFRTDEVTTQNLNPRTPLEFSQGTGGLFIMNTSVADMVRDNLKNLLLTNWGERVEQYDFGANLKPLTAELGTAAFDTEAINRIRNAVRKYLPYIELVQFATERLPEETTSGLAAVKVTVTYSVAAAGITGDAIGITLLASA